MALPPLFGAVQVRTADRLPAVVAVITGAAGNMYGTTATEAALAVEVPYALTAATVKVYEAPAVRPVSVRVVVEAS